VTWEREKETSWETTGVEEEGGRESPLEGIFQVPSETGVGEALLKQRENQQGDNIRTSKREVEKRHWKHGEPAGQ
jgi:hypothetical protein